MVIEVNYSKVFSTGSCRCMKGIIEQV